MACERSKEFCGQHWTRSTRILFASKKLKQIVSPPCALQDVFIGFPGAGDISFKIFEFSTDGMGYILNAEFVQSRSRIHSERPESRRRLMQVVFHRLHSGGRSRLCSRIQLVLRVSSYPNWLLGSRHVLFGHRSALRCERMPPGMRKRRNRRHGCADRCARSTRGNCLPVPKRDSQR